jgi:hypothetical protein
MAEHASEDAAFAVSYPAARLFTSCHPAAPEVAEPLWHVFTWWVYLLSVLYTDDVIVLKLYH